jgi:predicted ester cyclase
LTIHGFPPNLPANKEGFKQFIYLLWKAFPDAKVIERWNLVDMMLLMEQLKT